MKSVLTDGRSATVDSFQEAFLKTITSASARTLVEGLAREVAASKKDAAWAVERARRQSFDAADIVPRVRAFCQFCKLLD